jgi:DNA (cytosine-5)-methyltransferase 1
MRVGSLFSGIGGLDLGLERAGMEIVWQVEVDEWCRRVLERHWPDVARFRDVRDCHGEAAAVANPEGRSISRASTSNENARLGLASSGQTRRDTLQPVDLICGGFPCQPVSHAGQRKGESDSRWLWPEFYRIVREVKPRWVLVENVPGLRSIDDGRLFGGVLRDLAEAGYDAVWFDLSAADVGASHLRERVFIVAHADRTGARVEEHYSGGQSRLRTTVSPESEILRQGDGKVGAERAEADSGDVADASIKGLEGWKEAVLTEEGRNPYAGHRGSRTSSEGRDDWWAVEPDVGRVAHGIPARVDRLRGLGNAVVPQVAEVIGRWIMETA